MGWFYAFRVVNQRSNTETRSLAFLCVLAPIVFLEALVKPLFAMRNLVVIRLPISFRRPSDILENSNGSQKTFGRPHEFIRVSDSCLNPDRRLAPKRFPTVIGRQSGNGPGPT
jgi:hypothetical protein